MKKIEHYLDIILDKNKKEDMEELREMFFEMAEYIEENNETMYRKICEELYELSYGKVISEEVAEEWVESMNPEARWNMEETTQAMRNLGYDCNPIEFYVTANMMYSDNYNLVKDDEELALKLAKNWLEDKDVNKDKLYNYYKYVVE